MHFSKLEAISKLELQQEGQNQKLTAKVNKAYLQEFKNHPMVLSIFCPSLLLYLLLRVTHCYGIKINTVLHFFPAHFLWYLNLY